MPLDPHKILEEGPALPDSRAFTQADTRRHRLQRLQVGFVGLGTVVLLVGLANIIISSVQENRATLPEDLPPVTNQDLPRPRDPLANAGVVPELPAGTEAGSGQLQRTDPAAVAPGAPASQGN